MKKFLESQNFPTHLAPEQKNYKKIPTLARKLEKRILAIPAKKVQIVAHSMGGITVLRALQNPKIFKKVEQVITLGSPLNGCILGNLAFWEVGRNRKYLKLNSPELRKLNSNLKINRKIRALHSEFDGIVFPAKFTELRGARENKKLPVVSHAGLILAKKSWRIIAKKLVK